MKTLLSQNKLFITGTDTGVGKSIVTALLAHLFTLKGKRVAISKPIQTGSPKDTEYLAQLTKNDIPIFNTYSLKLPAAPLVASNDENKEISIEIIIKDIKNLEKEYDAILVEGIGGIAVPLSLRAKRSNPDRDCFVANAPRNDNYLVADLIKDLNYPVIVVCRPSLGTINHSILTLEYAKQKGLNVLGFVISGFNKHSFDKAELTAPVEIEKITGYKCIAKIPLLKENEIALHYTLDTV